MYGLSLRESFLRVQWSGCPALEGDGRVLDLGPSARVGETGIWKPVVEALWGFVVMC